MINASSQFITEVGKTSRRFRARFLLNGSELDCDISKIQCFKGSCASELSIGCVYAPYIEATLKRCNTDLDGEELTYQIGLYVQSQYEYITLGKFRVMDPDKGNGSVSFTAVGTLGQIGNNDYASALTYPAAIGSVISELETLTGKTISFLGITPGSYTVPAAITGKVRDVLGTIAGLYGGFVSEDNSGNIVIAAYNSGSSLSILPFRSQSIPAVRETPYSITGIHITVTEETEDDEGHITPEVYFEYGDPVIFQSNEWMTQDFFNRVVDNFVGLEFDLATIEISLGDPRVEPWDIVELTDLEGNTYNVPCFEITHTFDGGFSTDVSSAVDSTETTGTAVKGALSKYVERLDSDIYKAKTAAESAQELAASAEIAAGRAETAADQAEQTALYLDKTTYGTITYEYDNDGTIETVYKREDGTYYWVDDSEVVHDVEEADLVHDDEELVTNRQPDGLDTMVEKVRQDAKDAGDAAASANDSASSALLQLSEVEKVVDVLTWVAEHGQYTLTEDTEVQAGKYYFTAEFALTTDTAIDNTKTYYSEAAGVYTVVEEPVVSDIGSYYEGTFDVVNDPSATTGLYEISSVKEAVSNYIATHLALTDSGLYVQMDNDAYKLQIASNGINLWSGNKVIATYSDSVTLGDTESMHIVLSAGRLSFYDGESEVAYISTNTLSITSAEIKNDLRIGNFIWKPRDGRLTLMYSPIV